MTMSKEEAESKQIRNEIQYYCVFKCMAHNESQIKKLVKHYGVLGEVGSVTAVGAPAAVASPRMYRIRCRARLDLCRVKTFFLD